MISVIISTYNRAKLLKRAIKSVLNQSYKDFEIIVVDDCSTDNTEKTVKDFDDKRIKYIKLDKNFGNHSRPKNAGTLEARGEYIAYLDDDNTFRKDHLRALHKAITETNVDIVYGDRMIIQGGKTIGVGIYSDFNPNLLMQRNFIDTSDALIKKEAIFAVGGWDERSTRMLDWNLWTRMVKNGAVFTRVPLVLTDYYLHGDQLSAKHEKKEWNPIDVEVVLPFLNNEFREPRVAIFSITYDRLAYTKKCFKSMYDTAGYPFHHFIVDNGSKDGTVEYIKKTYPTMLLIENKVNRGISIASNQALNEISKGDYDIIIKVDNDALFKNKGWLATMVKIWKSNRKLALSCYIEGLRDSVGGAPRIARGTVCGEMVGITKHLGGICCFVDAKAYANFKWNEDSTLHGVQDLEFSQHLIKNGYTMGYLENWFCEHYEGTEGQEKRYPNYFERRKLEKITKPERTYEEIQSAESAFSRGTMWGERVKDTITRYSKYFQGKILDVGCNDGFAIETLQSQGFEVEGIDISKEKVAVALANNLKVKKGYMEDLPYKENEFDTVFCSHTLEHSKDVEKATSEIQRVAKRAIIIVPIETNSTNPGHTNPFTSIDEVKSLFKGTILFEEELNRFEREYVLIVDFENV